MNLVPEADNSGMMQEIKNYALRLANNSESLLENKNNNICEQFNAIINKHIAGNELISPIEETTILEFMLQ